MHAARLAVCRVPQVLLLLLLLQHRLQLLIGAEGLSASVFKCLLFLCAQNCPASGSARLVLPVSWLLQGDSG